MLLSLRSVMIISHFLKKNTVFILFVFLSAIFISFVWNDNVWMDEAFTASLVHTDLAGVIQRSMADTLPPLYNILLWFMITVFGYHIPVMKITSVLPMIATLFTGATVVRKRWGERSASLFMIFLTLMPLMIYYGVEIRMYSLGFCFATVSGIYAMEVVADGSKKNWAVFTCASVLAGYSHHFAFVTVAFSYLYLLMYFWFKERARIKEWLWCLLATFVMYLPCLVITLRQITRVSGYFSMPDIDIAMFVQYAVYPYTVGITVASVLCLALMSASVVLYVTKFRSSADDQRYYCLYCFATYYGVLVFGTVISKIMTANIFVDRYLFFATGVLWLFVAILFGKTDKKVYFAGIAASLVIGACTLVIEYRTEYGNSAKEEIAFLRDNVSAGDVFFSIGGHEEMENCIPFYTFVDDKTPELEFVTPLEDAVTLSEDRGTTLWITVLEGSEPAEDDLKALSDHSLKMEKAADFSFDRYKCEMYKVIREGL